MQRFKLVLAAVLAIAAITAITAATASAAEMGFLPTTTFTGEGGAGKLLTLMGTEIACGANTLKEGSMTNDKEGKIGHIDFTKCKALKTFAANSLNDAAETVLVDNVTYNVCFINKSTLDIGVMLHIPSPGVHIEVTAAKTLFLITGWVLGLLTPDVTPTTAYELKFGQSTTTKDQEFTKCEGGKTEVLLTEVNENKKPEEGALVQTDKLTMAAKTEMMES